MSSVSVIVPCYNQAIYLSECLQSVLDQTHTNWECIIVDDGSPDDTEKVAKNWIEKDSRFKYVKKENGGLSSARNAGIRAAKGNYVQLLDADDLLEPDKFKVQLSLFSENEKADVVYSIVRYFLHEDRTIRYHSFDRKSQNWQPDLNASGKDVLNALLAKNIFACNCPLIKIETIHATGYFDETLPNHEDYDYWIRMAIKGAFFLSHNTPGTYALVRLHGQSMSTDRGKMLAGFYRCNYQLVHYMGQNNLITREKYKSSIGRARYKLSKYLCSGKISFKNYETVLSSSGKKTLNRIKGFPKSMQFVVIILLNKFGLIYK